MLVLFKLINTTIVPLERFPVEYDGNHTGLFGCKKAFWNLKIIFFLCLQDLTRRNQLFRSEMICRVEEAKHEMESRLDSQRRHMVQKESILQNEIEELKVNMILFFSFFPVRTV